MITEAEKSQDLQLASWRPKRAVVWFQSEPEGLRTRKPDAVSSSPSPSPLVQRQEWGLTPLLEDRQKENSFPLSLFFYSSLSWTGQYPPTLGKAICFPGPTNLSIHVIQKCSHKQNNVEPNFWLHCMCN